MLAGQLVPYDVQPGAVAWRETPVTSLQYAMVSRGPLAVEHRATLAPQALRNVRPQRPLKGAPVEQAQAFRQVYWPGDTGNN